MKAHVLLCLPDQQQKEKIEKAIKEWGFYVKTVDDGAACMGEIERSTPEIVLCSSRVSLVSARKIYSTIQEEFPFIPFIFIRYDEQPWEDDGESWLLQEDLSGLKEMLFQKLKEIRGKVLVIDDNEEFRRTCSDILRSAEYDVTEAKDGKEGVEKCAREEFDIVLTDIHMPGMNGIEAARRIHRMRPASYIVVMTGEADEDEVHQALKAAQGHYACLRKPFDYPTFLLVMKSLRQEAIHYRKLAQRNIIQKTRDSFRYGIGAALHRFVEVKSALTLWIIVIVLAVSTGLLASWSVTALPKFIKQFVSKERARIKQELRQELEREAGQQREKWQKEQRQ